jgi:hypothetical protein
MGIGEGDGEGKVEGLGEAVASTGDGAGVAVGVTGARPTAVELQPTMSKATAPAPSFRTPIQRPSAVSSY